MIRRVRTSFRACVAALAMSLLLLPRDGHAQRRDLSLLIAHTSAESTTTTGLEVRYDVHHACFDAAAALSASASSGERAGIAVSRRIAGPVGVRIQVDMLRIINAGLRPSASVGAWFRHGRVTVTGSLERGALFLQPARFRPGATLDTISTPHDTVPPSAIAASRSTSDLRTATSAVVSIDGKFVGLEWQVAISRSLHLIDDRVRWDALIERHVTGVLSVIAAAGSRGPAAGVYATRSGHHLSIGIGLRRLSSNQAPIADSSPRFAIDTAVPGMATITVHDRRARTVDIRSDLTSWEPRPMRRIRGDSWVVTLPLSPGYHQLSIRRDGGAWQAPPGLPVGVGEFDDAVGVLIVR